MVATLKDLKLKNKVKGLKTRSMEKNLNYINENFEEIVQLIYEENFIDCIFEPFANKITKESFIKACDEKPIFGFDFDLLDDALSGTANWLFSPE